MTVLDLIKNETLKVSSSDGEFKGAYPDSEYDLLCSKEVETALNAAINKEQEETGFRLVSQGLRNDLNGFGILIPFIGQLNVKVEDRIGYTIIKTK